MTSTAKVYTSNVDTSQMSVLAPATVLLLRQSDSRPGRLGRACEIPQVYIAGCVACGDKCLVW
jgi:hypothetical protein